MALHSLNDIRNLQDPLKQFQVKFTISMIPALYLAIAQQKAASVLNGNFSTIDAKTLELRCTSFTYPGTKLGQSSLTIGAFRRKLGTIQNKSGVWNCKITEDQKGVENDIKTLLGVDNQGGYLNREQQNLDTTNSNNDEINDMSNGPFKELQKHLDRANKILGLNIHVKQTSQPVTQIGIKKEQIDESNNL